MAQITVVEVVTDPDFLDPMTVVRRAGSVGEDGELTLETTQIPILASIQSASSDGLVLLTDLQRAEGSIEVVTVFPLRGQGSQGPPDLILWRGRVWECKVIDNYRNFANGQGHVEAIATLTDLQAGSP